MKLITKTRKQMLKRFNYVFNKDVKTITLSTGVVTEIINGVITVKN